jgi:hypothetical protein
MLVCWHDLHWVECPNSFVRLPSGLEGLGILQQISLAKLVSTTLLRISVLPPGMLKNPDSKVSKIVKTRELVKVECF